MALVVPNAGAAKLMENFVNKTAPENLSLRLFKNDYTPVEGSTAANFTVADFTGYSNITLTGASWGAASVADPSEIAYAEQTFASTAAQTLQNIYGYFVVGGTDGVIRWAERFTDAPYAISNDGDQIKITPKITGD